MAEFEWDKNEAGHIVTHLLENVQTATLSDRACVVRLEYSVNAGQSNEAHEALQLRMSRDQAREVGQLLLRLADNPHIPAPPTRSRH